MVYPFTLTHWFHYLLFQRESWLFKFFQPDLPHTYCFTCPTGTYISISYISECLSFYVTVSEHSKDCKVNEGYSRQIICSLNIFIFMCPQILLFHWLHCEVLPFSRQRPVKFLRLLVVTGLAENRFFICIFHDPPTSTSFLAYYFFFF